MNEHELTKRLSKEKILACTVIKNGSHIFEFYKNKKSIDKLHKINSCTKSILSLLIGIAFDKGFLHDLHQPISDYFPKYFKGQKKLKMKEISIYHLLTMTPGLHFPEWEEWNGFAPMVQGGDIIKFVLDRELIYDPGEKMNYNSGCSHLLTAILQQVTGESALQFAKKHLFHHLDIKKVEWYSDNKGVNRGADGIRLTIHDMEKIGKLMLQKGNWSGKQIVSEGWIRQAILPHFTTYKHIGDYGLHWWSSTIDPNLGHQLESNRYHFTLGFGGQNIIIVPSQNLVVVFISEMYNASLKPLEIFRTQILKSLINVVS